MPKISPANFVKSLSQAIEAEIIRAEFKKLPFSIATVTVLREGLEAKLNKILETVPKKLHQLEFSTKEYTQVEIDDIIKKNEIIYQQAIHKLIALTYISAYVAGRKKVFGITGYTTVKDELTLALEEIIKNSFKHLIERNQAVASDNYLLPENFLELSKKEKHFEKLFLLNVRDTTVADHIFVDFLNEVRAGAKQKEGERDKEISYCVNLMKVVVRLNPSLIDYWNNTLLNKVKLVGALSIKFKEGKGNVDEGAVRAAVENLMNDDQKIELVNKFLDGLKKKKEEEFIKEEAAAHERARQANAKLEKSNETPPSAASSTAVSSTKLNSAAIIAALNSPTAGQSKPTELTPTNAVSSASISSDSTAPIHIQTNMPLHKSPTEVKLEFSPVNSPLSSNEEKAALVSAAIVEITPPPLLSVRNSSSPISEQQPNSPLSSPDLPGLLLTKTTPSAPTPPPKPKIASDLLSQSMMKRNQALRKYSADDADENQENAENAAKNDTSKVKHSP